MINNIPILTFHSIDHSGSVISINPSRFRQLLKKLKQKAYQSISFDEVVKWLSGEITFNSPRFVITFDDGFENVYRYAFPLLNESGFQATVFLATGYCEQKNNWLTQSKAIPILPMLKWKQIKEMLCFGFDFQAHTQSHPMLPSLNPEQVKKELLDSKKEIEDRLGKNVDFFAYPHRYFNKGEDVLVRQFFKGACSTRLGVVHSQSDRYLLPRIDTYYFSHQITSDLFMSPVFRPYLEFRHIFRLLRQSLKKHQ